MSSCKRRDGRTAARTTWQIGSPSANGLYWFDVEFQDLVTRADWRPLVADVWRGETFVCGHGGSGPLSMYRHKSIEDRARHVRIAEPTDDWSGDWPDKHEFYAWVRSPVGRVGFAILTSDYTGPSGTVIWSDRKNVNHGEWLHADEDWGYEEVLPPEPPASARRQRR